MENQKFRFKILSEMEGIGKGPMSVFREIGTE
jgi:hypothetical protein